MSTCRRVFAPPKVKSPLRRTTVHEISLRSGDGVVKQPFCVVPGNETSRAGQQIFSVENIAFCNTLGESPETLFIVCHCRRTCKYFVYVFNFSTVERCEVFLQRVKKLFQIEEDDVKTKVEKRFSCPLIDNVYDDPLVRTNSLLRNPGVVKKQRLCGVSSNFVWETMCYLYFK